MTAVGQTAADDDATAAPNSARGAASRADGAWENGAPVDAGWEGKAWEDGARQDETRDDGSPKGGSPKDGSPKDGATAEGSADGEGRPAEGESGSAGDGDADVGAPEAFPATGDRQALLDTLRRQNYGRAEPKIYHLLRRFSIHVTLRLAPTAVSPNMVSVAGLVLTVAAAGLVATGDGRAVLAAALLLLSAYVLDCVDGELARLRNQSSRLGIHIEHLGNWLVVGLLQIGLSHGAFVQTGNTLFLLLGMASLFGWYGFYFLFIQLQSWIAGQDGFQRLRGLSRVLVLVMPLDENIFLAGTALNRLPEATVLAAVTGLGLFGAGLLLFFIPVYQAHKRSR